MNQCEWRKLRCSNMIGSSITLGATVTVVGQRECAVAIERLSPKAFLVTRERGSCHNRAIIGGGKEHPTQSDLHSLVCRGTPPPPPHKHPHWLWGDRFNYLFI
ncbi:hypothetical protein HAX54_017363 [Datura stramonium]|uniref:Uncharacterized protein n=1 Tax=Datura stramonium TaxID=4076 RepID=A0ABS8S140_DATST|nr:hypothetical protein [Datura stramonium]